MKLLFGQWLRFSGRGTLIACLFAALTACASGLVNHAFSFDIRESPGAQILDYRYGDSRQPSARATETDLAQGTVSQIVGIHGDMLRGDTLYVKWRIKSSGKVYEDTVDLKSLLPRDISKHRIHFIVKGDQLFVYLITPERRPPEMPPNGPREYQYLKVITLSSSRGREVATP